MGKACEDLGKWDDAREFYLMAAQRLNSHPDNKYEKMISDAVESALERVRSIHQH
jgi:hypothetical protein